MRARTPDELDDSSGTRMPHNDMAQGDCIMDDIGTKRDTPLDGMARDISSGIGRAAEWLSDTPIWRLATTVRYGARNAAHGVSDGLERIDSAYGYAGIDVWNLGEAQAEHIAKVLARYADETDDADAADEARRRATGIGSFASDMETIAAIGVNAVRDIDAVADMAGRRLDAFIDDWDWFGREFLSEGYQPPRHDATRARAAGDVQHVPLGDAIGDAIGDASRAVEALSSKAAGGVGWVDMGALPEFESRRMASMLRTHADRNIGFPEGYHGSGRELLADERGDGWEQRPIGVSLLFSDALRSERYDGIRTRVTNGQVDADFAAWEEDAFHAAGAIEAWGDWLHAYRSPAIGTRLAPGTPEVEALRAEFLRCWHWAGANVQDLWF